MLAPAKRPTTGSSTNIAMPLLRSHTFDGIDAECRVFSTILFDHFGGGFLIHATHGRLIGVVIIGRITGDDEDRIGVRTATASLRATGQLAATLISMARAVGREAIGAR